jgi:hypothetical protein
MDIFSTDLGHISNKHCERFHQGMEKQHQWEWNQTVLTGYCGRLKEQLQIEGREKEVKLEITFY